MLFCFVRYLLIHNATDCLAHSDHFDKDLLYFMDIFYVSLRSSEVGGSGGGGGGGTVLMV